MSNYDSTKDTQEHIGHVRDLINHFGANIAARAEHHDATKLCDPEKTVFDEVTPRLRGLTYGSPEYKQSLADMGPALAHHYTNNRHHPEHFEEEQDARFLASPVSCMDLLDIVEMLCDWKAATLRHADGNILKSIEINRKRFGIDDQLANILINTVRDMGWK
jgi:hypothetical protein